jgi:hypothetical protein
VGSVGGGPLQSAHRLTIAPTTLTVIRPLQTGPYVGYGFQNTNWLYDTVSQQLTAVCWSGMPASVFGPTVTFTPGANLALTLDGAFLVQGNTSDGTNRILLIKGPTDITPVLAQGQPAPGLPGFTIGAMSASGNQSADVAMLTRLVDGDTNPFNDRSALFAGPYTNVALLAQSPPGSIWGGGTLITRFNHVLGVGASGQGIYKLAASTNETTTFTPLPPFPHPPLVPLGATLIASSLNALGQYVVLYGYSSGAANPLNPGIDLWLFNPGDGWTNIARRGSNIVASGETIRVNDIGFQGGGGAGYARGLSDDGTLLFCVNGTHIVTTGVTPCEGLAGLLAFRAAGGGGVEEFHYTGLLGPNWHATTNDCPPVTNWKDANGVGQPFPPGDFAQATAAVFINAFAGETIRLYERAVNIGSLRANQGLLQLQDHLTLNQPSGLYDLRMEAPRGSLTVNHSEIIISNNFEWATGTIDGTAQFGPGALLTTNLFLTNGTTVRLHALLVPQKLTDFDNGTTLIMANGALRTRGEFRAGTGTITKSSGLPPVQNNGLLRKRGPSDFTIDTPYHGFEAFLRQSPWGIEVEQGRLRLCDGGLFLGYHTNEVDFGAELELAGLFTFQGEYTLFRGLGELTLGKRDKSVELRVFPGTRLEFDVGGGGTHFTNGVISGDGPVKNSGVFYWEGGVIKSILPVFFQNEGTLHIEDAPAPLRLERPLLNSDKVLQRGDLEMVGTVSIVNRDTWEIIRPTTISGSAGTFQNAGADSKLVVDLDEPGTVVIEGEFSNFDGYAPLGPFGPGFYFPPGVFNVGVPDELNEATIVRLQGDVLNLENKRLLGGEWNVFNKCSLEFPSDIETIGSGTRVSLHSDGDIQSLQLKQNRGWFVLRDKEYATPAGAGLLNDNGAKLEMHGASVLTVNGSFTNRGFVQCKAPARIVVNGDLIYPEGEYFEMESQLQVTGIIYLAGPGRYMGQIDAPAVFFLENAPVGSSPGRLNVNGAVVLTNTTVLEMEVAGTQTNQYDILAVNGPLALGGRLALSVIDGFRPAPTDSFPIIQATSMTGLFTNAPNGQRLATFDGYGSFLVTYTPTSVVLSAFQTNPNPPPTVPGSLQPPTFSFNTLNLTLTGSPGRDYILQSSTNLFDWLSFLTNNAGFDGQLRFELPPPTEPYQFFRALAH